MKTFFVAAAVLVSTSSVHAYIVEKGGGDKASPFVTTDWSPKSFAPKIRIRPLGEEVRIRPHNDPMVRRESKINVDWNADNIIRREYSAWTQRYGKVKDAKRFEIFKRNFVKQMEMNRENEEFFLLNEFGDMTEEEYIAHSQASDELKGSRKNEIDTTRVKRVEDLTKEIIESMLESSRKSVSQERQTIVEEKATSNEAFSYYPSEREISLPENIYTMLVETTQRTILHTANLELSLFLRSYNDILYRPMQLPDDFALLPYHLSAAVSPASETTRNHLIDTIGSEWEGDMYYAMRIKDE